MLPFTFINENGSPSFFLFLSLEISLQTETNLRVLIHAYIHRHIYVLKYKWKKLNMNTEYINPMQCALVINNQRCVEKVVMRKNLCLAFNRIGKLFILYKYMYVYLCVVLCTFSLNCSIQSLRLNKTKARVNKFTYFIQSFVF